MLKRGGNFAKKENWEGERTTQTDRQIDRNRLYGEAQWEGKLGETREEEKENNGLTDER